MPKKQAPRKRRGGEKMRPEYHVLVEWPDGLRLETPALGKKPKKTSDPVRGGQIVVNERALLERLAKQRREEKPVPGTLPSPLARLWRRGLQLRARLRRALKQPEVLLSKAELRQVIENAVEAGRVWERLVWREGGGIVGEVVKASESRLNSIEALAEANRKREAGLTEGLKHKFDLISSCQPTISRRAIAQLLLDESIEDNRRCHDCQRSKWLEDDNDEMQCERYRLNNRCRECWECEMWYEYLSKWRSGRRKIFLKKRVPKNKTGERLLDALARRIGAIDLRRSRRPANGSPQ